MGKPPDDFLDFISKVVKGEVKGVKMEVEKIKMPMPDFIKEMIKDLEEDRNQEYIGDINPFHFKQMRDIKFELKQAKLDAEKWTNENMRDLELKLMQLKKQKEEIMKEFDKVFKPRLNALEERRKQVWKEISLSVGVDPDGVNLKLDDETGKIYKID